MSAKASDGFDGVGEPEKIDFAVAEFPVGQSGVDKLAIGVLD